MKKTFITYLFFLFYLCSTAAPKIIYVRSGGSTTADGLTWANSVTLDRARNLVNYYNTLATPIETQIWAKAGTYNLTTDAFQLTIPISIYGGFTGTETALSQRNWIANKCILNQTTTKPVIFSNSTSDVDVLLDGWILQNGNRTTGAGSCGSLSPGCTLRHCIIRNNKTAGAAVLLFNGISGSTKKVTIDNCLIINNESALSPIVTQQGANAKVDIINTTIANNLSTNTGSGVSLGITTATNVELNVYNSIIYKNRTSSEAAACISSTAATKTLSNNAWDIAPTTGTLTDNVLLKATPFINATPYLGVSNETDKLFSLISNSNYNLRRASGCVNAGKNSFVPSVTTLDLDGLARKNNSMVDIGCYESYYVKYPAVVKNDVLSVQNGIYYLDGEPFVEIGWNKFDIAWTLWDQTFQGNQLYDSNWMVTKQRNSIEELASSGVKTIRFFSCVHPSTFSEWLSFYNDPIKHEFCWLPTDKALDICEDNNIRAIVSLVAENFVDRTTSENLRELVADPNSASRAFLYKYLDEVINRYKSHRAVLAWEISNEMTNKADLSPGTRVNPDNERQPTMAQLAQFYKDVIAKIKSIDNLRMVTLGGSYVREHAYGLSQLTSSQTSYPSKRDTYDQNKSIYKLIYDNSGFENVDIHFYMRKDPNYEILKNDGVTPLVMNANLYNTLSESIGKPLMLGEFGAMPAAKGNSDYWITGNDWFETFTGESTEARQYVLDAVNKAVNSGCKLIYWWTYDSHRSMDQNDPQRMDLDIERTPNLFQMVLDGSQRLKLKHKVTTSNSNLLFKNTKIWHSGNNLYFAKELIGEKCFIYDIQGTLIKQFTADGCVALNLEKAGIFIVKSQDSVIKISNN